MLEVENTEEKQNEEEEEKKKKGESRGVWGTCGEASHVQSVFTPFGAENPVYTQFLGYV